MYYDTKYSPTKNLKPLNFAKGRTFAPKIILECNSLKHHLQDAGVQKHTLELESCGDSNGLEEIDGVPKGATSSFASPPHQGDKG